MIRRCCELKAMVVSKDERETTGLRAVLNYGHTFGHAIEAVMATDTTCMAKLSRSECKWQPTWRQP